MSAREHTPKTAALLALEDGALSEAGRVRIERHLWRCERCRAERETIRRYRALTAEVTATPLPEIDVEQLERRLLEAARPKRRIRPAGLLAAAVFAAAAFFLVPRTVPHPEQEQQVAVREVPVAEPPAPPAGVTRARVTALAGIVRASHAEHPSIDVAPDTELWSGWTLHTAPGSRLDLRLWDGTGVSLVAESRLRLAKLTPDRIDLVLDHGEVTAEVERPSPAARFRIAAGDYRVEVKGTWFAVRRLRRGTSVDVWRGSVEVTLEDGTSVASVAAPGRWVEHAVGGEPDPDAASPRPFGLSAAWDELGALELPLAMGVERWIVADEPLLAAGNIRLRLPRGQVEVVGLRTDGQRLLALVEVDNSPVGTRFDPRTLALAPGPEPEQEPESEHAAAGVAPEILAGIVAAGRGHMQRCYDLELKRHPGASPQFSLRIGVSAAGHVRSVRARPAGAASPELEECLTGVARGWSFPASGAGITFDAPLRFQARSNAMKPAAP